MTMPSGLLMWGQGGEYNAADDRRVIEALSGRRTGVIRRPDLRASTGLTFIVPAWLAVVSCADGTSAVIGNGNEDTFSISGGPATGSRVDYLWADIDPAAGTWQLSLISQAATVGRGGILLATITVPAGANTAAACSWTVPSLTFGGAGGILARSLVTGAAGSDPRTWTSFGTAPDVGTVGPIQCFAGRIYRLEFYTPNAYYTANVGAGQNLRVAFNRVGQGQLGVASSDWFSTINVSQSISHSWVGTLPAGAWSFAWRMWTISTGTFRYDNSGQGIHMTFEDCGPTHLSMPSIGVT